MDILIALLVVLIAWFLLDSLFAVLLVALATALVVWVIRSSRRL